MSEYYRFQPGEYLDFEREEVQLRWDVYHGKRPMPGPPGMPPMDPNDENSLPPFMRPRRYTEEEILAYNKKWTPTIRSITIRPTPGPTATQRPRLSGL